MTIRYTTSLDTDHFVLTDTKRNQVVFDYSGEPEDMILTRNLKELVDEMNRLARIIEQQTEALQVAAEIADRAPGCAVPNCSGCARNRGICDQIAAALKLGTEG